MALATGIDVKQISKTDQLCFGLKAGIQVQYMPCTVCMMRRLGMGAECSWLMSGMHSTQWTSHLVECQNSLAKVCTFLIILFNTYQGYASLVLHGTSEYILSKHKRDPHGRRKRGGWGGLGCPTFSVSFWNLNFEPSYSGFFYAFFSLWQGWRSRAGRPGNHRANVLPTLYACNRETRISPHKLRCPSVKGTAETWKQADWEGSGHTFLLSVARNKIQSNKINIDWVSCAASSPGYTGAPETADADGRVPIFMVMVVKRILLSCQDWREDFQVMFLGIPVQVSVQARPMQFCLRQACVFESMLDQCHHAFYVRRCVVMFSGGIRVNGS